MLDPCKCWTIHPDQILKVLISCWTLKMMSWRLNFAFESVGLKIMHEYARVDIKNMLEFGKCCAWAHAWLWLCRSIVNV